MHTSRRAGDESLSALWGEREGPIARRWEGEVGDRDGNRSGIPYLTPALSAPRGGEGATAVKLCRYSAATRAGCWFITALASFAMRVPSKKRGFPVPHSRTAFSKVKSRKSSFVINPRSTSS
jgi:hypothetical protein